MLDSKFDLIVVGTSFASSFFLKKYLEQASPSVRVLALERGMYFGYGNRLKVRREEMSLPPEYKDSNTTYTSESSKAWTFEPNFGGCSNCWTGCTPRFMPNDFQMKTKYGIGMDWPITYNELDDYYDETEAIMAISGPDVTPFPKKTKYPLPPHILHTVDRVMQKEYGDLYISQPAARASRATGSRGQCCASSTCGLCPVNAKFTIENSLKYLYDDPRVTLLENSQAYTLRIENQVAKSIVVRQGDKDVEFFAETFALGANAIFNSHILLNSGDTNEYTGVGISEQVGTYGRFYLNGLENLGGSSLITANGYMFYDTPDRSKYAGCLVESFGSPFIRNERGKWRQIALFKFIFEDLPEKRNYVTTSADVLKPKIVYEGHSAYLQAGLDNLEANVKKYFSVLPLEGFELDGYNQPSEFHICSTTRMSNDASTGVIDKGLVHHNYRNVLVLGSGSFTTMTPANPTLTLSALSLLAADKYFKK